MMKELSSKILNDSGSSEYIFIPLDDSLIKELVRGVIDESLNYELSQNRKNLFDCIVEVLKLNIIRNALDNNIPLRNKLETTGVVLWGALTVFLFIFSVYLLFF